MDKRLLEILVCPVCKGSLRLLRDAGNASAASELICDRDRLAFPIRDDIPVMLVDAARSLDGDGTTAG